MSTAMELEKQFISIEQKLWSDDAVFYKQSLIEEALVIFPETDVITNDVVVGAILTENVEGRRRLKLSLIKSGACRRYSLIDR